MKKMEDAFGCEIYERWKGNESVVEIVERDDGYIEAGRTGPPFYLSDHKKWPGYERRALRYARGRTLDIGCGGGRCLLHFQKKGFDVVGIDISPLALKVCRERGARKVFRKSITEIGADLGRFDTIIMFGNNLGLLGNRRRARWLLKKMFKLTSEKGRIIGESINPYETTLPEHLWYHRRNRRLGRMGGQIRLRIRYKKYITPWFDYLFMSPEELTAIVAGTGWAITKFFQDKGPVYCVLLEKERERQRRV